MVDDPYGGTPYDSGLSYGDVEVDAGPSRPAPIPYDDPYSDTYDTALPDISEADDKAKPLAPSPEVPQRGRGRGRGGPHRLEGGGRARGRGRRNDRGRGRGRGRVVDHRAAPESWSGEQSMPIDEYDPHHPRPLSPTSFAIARATGQYADGSAVVPPHAGGGGAWGYPQYPGQGFDFSFPYQYPQVQPHINPRFAANFGLVGMDMGHPPYGVPSGPYSQDASGYAVDGSAGLGWNQDWGPGSQGHPGQFGGGSGT